MKPFSVFLWGSLLGSLVGSGVTAFTQPDTFALRQRACWFAVDHFHGDTLAVLHRWPDCYRVLMDGETIETKAPAAVLKDQRFTVPREGRPSFNL